MRKDPCSIYVGQRDKKSQKKQDEHETKRAGHKGKKAHMKIEGPWIHKNLGEHKWNFPHMVGGVLRKCFWITNSELDSMNSKYEN